MEQIKLEKMVNGQLKIYIACLVKTVSFWMRCKASTAKTTFTIPPII